MQQLEKVLIFYDHYYIVLRHVSVERVDMVDLDEQVMEMSKQYLPTYHDNCYDDKRLHLIVDDAKAVLEQAPNDTYDVIIMDVCDPMPDGPCFELYTSDFYELCKKKLTSNGVFVTQAGSTERMCLTAS